MPIITEVKLKVANHIETLPTEIETGLRFAVVYDGKKVIALFDDLYWAEKFVGDGNDHMSFTIRDVAE